METTEKIEFTDQTGEYLELAHDQALRFGATPLDVNSEIYGYQQKIFDELFRRIDDNRPRDELGNVELDTDWLHEFVQTNFISRFTGRQMRNYNSYCRRLQDDDTKLDQNDRAIVDKARAGAASPLELLQVRELLGMGSIELARHSHPYIADDDILNDMSSSVHAAIEASGHDYTPGNDAPRYRVRNSDVMTSPKNTFSSHMNEREPRGLLITRKRNIALLDDDTLIIERTSFVLRLDILKDVSPKLAKRLLSLNINTVQPEQWVDDITDVMREVQSELHALNFDESGITVPISTTVYAYNKTTHLEAIEAERQKEEAKKAEEMLPEWVVEARERALREKQNNDRHMGRTGLDLSDL